MDAEDRARAAGRRRFVFNTAKTDMHEISYAMIEMIRRRSEGKSKVNIV